MTVLSKSDLLRLAIAAALAAGGITTLSGCSSQVDTAVPQASAAPSTKEVTANDQKQADTQAMIKNIEKYLVFNDSHELSLSSDAKLGLSSKELAFANASLTQTNSLVEKGEAKFGDTPLSSLKATTDNKITTQWLYQSGWGYYDGCYGWADTSLEWWGRYMSGDTCFGNRLKYTFNRTANDYNVWGFGAGFSVGALIAGPVGAAVGTTVGDKFPGWVYSSAANSIERNNWGNGIKVYIYVCYIWIGVEHRW